MYCGVQVCPIGSWCVLWGPGVSYRVLVCIVGSWRVLWGPGVSYRVLVCIGGPGLTHVPGHRSDIPGPPQSSAHCLQTPETPWKRSISTPTTSDSQGILDS